MNQSNNKAMKPTYVRRGCDTGRTWLGIFYICGGLWWKRCHFVAYV